MIHCLDTWSKNHVWPSIGEEGIKQVFINLKRFKVLKSGSKTIEIKVYMDATCISWKAGASIRNRN